MQSGILVIDKPTGMTSHDVVARVRRCMHTRRVGHAGTLDPDATGVLVLCVGEATRLLEYMAAEEKAYVGQVRFGIGTDTDDATGKVVRQADAGHLNADRVRQVMATMEGPQMQIPPVYSAVHVNGRRAYDLARAGETPELPARPVHIHTFELLHWIPGDKPTGDFDVVCSKGTYVRALCRDLGEKLGVPAHMSRLRRTRSGIFRIEQSVSLDVFETVATPEQYLLSPLSGLSMPKLRVTEEVAQKLSVGQSVPTDSLVDCAESSPEWTEGDLAAATMGDNELVAVLEYTYGKERGQMPAVAFWKPRKVFWKRELHD